MKGVDLVDQSLFLLSRNQFDLKHVLNSEILIYSLIFKLIN